MSAPAIVTKTLIQNGGFSIELATALQKKYPNLPPAEEIVDDPDLIKFFKKQEEPTKSTQKKVSIEERRGVYDGGRCDARVWHDKTGSGGLGYDDIQCHYKKVEDGCFCKKHAKIHNEGVLWTGKITEPRPENPVRTDGTTMSWSTDKDGNDIVKEKKKKKTPSPKKKNVEKEEKSPNDMEIEELIELLKKKKKEKEEEDKKKKETIDEEEKEGSEGGIGAGVGFEEEESSVLTKTSNKTEPCNGQSEEEEETFIVRKFNGIEYQINTEDNTVICIEGYEIVGEWDQEEEKIIFKNE